AHLRLPQLDHVLPEVLLFLRPAEEEVPRGLRVPGPCVEGAAGSTGGSGVEIQGGPPHPHPSPRRGRSADHRLAPRSVRLARCPHRARTPTTVETGDQETAMSRQTTESRVDCLHNDAPELAPGAAPGDAGPSHPPHAAARAQPRTRDREAHPA